MSRSSMAIILTRYLGLVLLFSFVSAKPARLQDRASSIDASSINGKFLFGYQGFFRRPGQGNDHWSINYGEIPGPSNPGAVQVDMLPAVEQYPNECLFTSNFVLPDGSKAKLYESNCTGIVDTHFRWMQENSIDGILVQRFYGDIGDASFLQLLGQIRTAAEKYGRVFAVEYDLSQIRSSEFSNVVSNLLHDYTTNVAPLVSSRAYLHHQGRPVLELWGFGIDKTKLNAADCSSIFHTLRSANPNPYVIMGVQQAWRSESSSNPDYYNVYTQADVIQPWTVGAYDNSNYQGFYTGTTVPDKTLTDQLGIGYSPVVLPGSSDRNRNGGNGPFGNRASGSFYEAQLKNVLKIKPKFVFGAMFDEFPESTQVIATLRSNEVPPAANPGFYGIDNNMDHNFYLQMAGRYAVQLHQLWA